jgi:hypothetical protein
MNNRYNGYSLHTIKSCLEIIRGNGYELIMLWKLLAQICIEIDLICYNGYNMTPSF